MSRSHYTGRAVLPPSFVTVTDSSENDESPLPLRAVRGPSAFPVAHLTSALNVTVVEPRYVRHAQAHLLGQSTLDPRRGREDPAWAKMSRREKKAREDKAMALAHTSQIGQSLSIKEVELWDKSTEVGVARRTDLRRYVTFADLVSRVVQPDLAFSRHVELVNADQSPFWPWWPLDELPVRRVRACENMTVPWECGEYCRGVDELKHGPIHETWLALSDIKW